MADDYNTKVYMKQGGDELVVEEGGAITIEGEDLKTVLDLLLNLPTENVEAPAIWNDGGVLKVGTAT